MSTMCPSGHFGRAGRLGVDRDSAELKQRSHGEHEGLLNPDRTSQSHARRYRAPAITEARIVAALRGDGHRIPPISRVLEQLREHGLTAEAQALLDERLSDLRRRSVALLAASGHLYALLNERTGARTVATAGASRRW